MPYNHAGTSTGGGGGGTSYGTELEDYALENWKIENGYVYLGKTKANGNWVIVRFNLADNEARYAKGSSGFPTAWDVRAIQSYDYHYITY